MTTAITPRRWSILHGILLTVLCVGTLLAMPQRGQAQAYAVYGTISDFAGGTDADGDGYYETFSFNLGIDADITPGSASVYAKMICTTTGQVWWSSTPWTITGTATDYRYFAFDQSDFAGYYTGNTSLDFTVELWNAAKSVKLATDTTITNEPVKADTAPASYAVYANISNFVGGTDADSDGYYETFDFKIGVDADVTPGSASVYAKMICTTTGQSWWSTTPWTITGTATDYMYFDFDETDFAGYLSGNTNLDFTVELWDASKAVKLATDTGLTNEPVKADSVSTSYDVYGSITNFTGGADADGDGYYETFDFSLAIDADAVPGPATVYAKIICTTTGQVWWSTNSWTVSGTAIDYQYFAFDETDFAGHLSGNTNLDFTVELWDASKTVKLSTDTGITNEPVKADIATTYAVYGSITNFVGGTDVDGDGYYETFDFNLTIDADVTPGSASVYAKIICTTTGQNWWSSNPWTISGTAVDNQNFAFDEADFAGYISGNTNLDFTVEIWNASKTVKLATDTGITNEPVRADVAAGYAVYGTIDDFVGGTDADGDGYYETFDFRIGVDADVTPGSASVYARMICTTTGQAWWSTSPWTITGTATDYHYFAFDETNFAGVLSGNTNLDFTVELWDASKTVKLATDTGVTNEPVKADAYAYGNHVTVYGYVKYLDRNTTPHPVRYAKVVVYDDDTVDQVLGTATTNGDGYYELNVPNTESGGEDIYVRVTTEGVTGAYAGAAGAIGAVTDDGSNPLPYALQSSVRTNVTATDLRIDLTAPNTGTNAGAFSVYDALVEAFHQTFTKYGEEKPAIAIHWPADGTYFFDDTIYAVQGDRWDRDVLMHEYGHFIAQQHAFLQGSVGAYSSHSWTEDLRTLAAGYPVSRTEAQARNLAFREAWPTFFAISTQYDETHDSCYNDTEDLSLTNDLDADTSLHVSPGQFIEAMNCCALWDIFDNTNNTSDNQDTFGINDHAAIWQVMNTQKPNDIQDFWNGWFQHNANPRDLTRIFLDHRMTFIAQTPTGPLPASGATGQAITVDLDWANATNATSYDVYFGTTTSPAFVGSTTSSNWTLPNLSNNTKYYWMVVAKGNHAEAAGPLWNFTTVAGTGTSVTPTTVALTVNKTAPQTKNTTITLTAVPSGGVNIEYYFRAGYQDGTGWHWSDLGGQYTGTTTRTWTPTLPANYTLVVYARGKGLTNFVYASRYFLINDTKGVTPTTVTLTVNKTAPQTKNTTIALTAVPSGGTNIEYYFRAGYQDGTGWHWSDLGGQYTGTTTRTWTPTIPANYTLVVYARGKGLTNFVYASRYYRITDLLPTAVSLTCTPGTKQTVKKPVTLTANATGGGTVEYRFRVGYQDGTGWHWTDLTSPIYRTTNSCVWTPTVARTYTVAVYAREQYGVATYRVYASKYFTVTP